MYVLSVSLEAERKRTRLAATAAGQAAMVTGTQEATGGGEAAPGSGSGVQ
jgi:20S proteasome subunit alpha 4